MQERLVGKLPSGPGDEADRHAFCRKLRTERPTFLRETIITELLGAVRLRDFGYIRCELRAPWGMKIAEARTTFHIVVAGSCWLRLEGKGGPIKLCKGDLLVLPRGGTQDIGDSYASPIVDTINLCQSEPFKPAALVGGSDRSTSLVCGWMQCENAATDPLLAILPAWIHVKTERASNGASLHTMIAQLLNALHPCQSGAAPIVSRLADVVIMEAVREYLERNLDVGEGGWLAAIRDPQVGPALVLLHTRPGEPWTVASLARHVAVSRSLFAAKFARLVGEPPVRYLTRLRLNSAALSLRSTNLKLAAVAAEAGYGSSASLTKAFKRQLGMPPGEYRRTRFEQVTRIAALWRSRSIEDETGYKLCG